MKKLLIGLIFITACSGERKYSGNVDKDWVGPNTVRIVDHDYGVVCYTYYSYGVACVKVDL